MVFPRTYCPLVELSSVSGPAGRTLRPATARRRREGRQKPVCLLGATIRTFYRIIQFLETNQCFKLLFTTPALVFIYWHLSFPPFAIVCLCHIFQQDSLPVKFPTLSISLTVHGSSLLQLFQSPSSHLHFRLQQQEAVPQLPYGRDSNLFSYYRSSWARLNAAVAAYTFVLIDLGHARIKRYSARRTYAGTYPASRTEVSAYI